MRCTLLLVSEPRRAAAECPLLARGGNKGKASLFKLPEAVGAVGREAGPDPEG